MDNSTQAHYFDSGTSISMDTCAIKQREMDNSSIVDYYLFNAYQPQDACQNHYAKVIDTQTSYPNLNLKVGYGVSSCFIDQDTQARYNSELTHGPERKTLSTRQFQPVPDLSHGCLVPDLETMIKEGNDTVRYRQCDRLTEHDYNRNVPFTPCMSSFIEGLAPALPNTFSIGENSREMMRSKKYLTKCGYQFDGHNWLPQAAK